jgi:hypothetical protein
MTRGTLTADEDLCSTDLYFNPVDGDGSGQNAWGPAWSTTYNHGCPLDDVGGRRLWLQSWLELGYLDGRRELYAGIRPVIAPVVFAPNPHQLHYLGDRTPHTTRHAMGHRLHRHQRR